MSDDEATALRVEIQTLKSLVRTLEANQAALVQRVGDLERPNAKAARPVRLIGDYFPDEGQP